MKSAICVALAVVAVGSTAAASSGDCAFGCPGVENPVCGSDGVTYSNKCYLNLEACKSNSGITKVYDGECLATSSSDLSSSSSSSSESTQVDTYNDECEMRRVECKNKDKIPSSSPSSAPSAEASRADLDNDDECSFACFDVYRPVIGDDGKTYSNECYMRRAKCKNKDTSTDV
ncbi:hypothetical protein BBJ29_005878 [Phytophthora kernoviae]|uniref:Kazal-like domain-containing protein n=1 Tax=Phytophthora kernoviae TaxID=325452 RepID=A0A3F2RGL5_9STRA|nr:hypothetical protein BBJ29_005878 [Phytophthora kernoviae]RLN56456.1 hypothetical protein BBP00_00007997 [Phytophthora kernoviae]